jgi:ubiquinone biosynthesis protein
MSFLYLSKNYRIARRLREIVNVFIGHGFGNLIDQIHLGSFIPFFKRMGTFTNWPTILRGPYAPQRLRTAFAELGPTFIKLAQVIASRPDLVPARFANEFQLLQDQVPPFPAEVALRIVEEELNLPPDRIFRTFDPEPLAAASIGQVHGATLLDGSEVIVKVQRPDITATIEVDIEILFTAARLMEAHIPESRFLNPVGIVVEFQKTIRKELNYREEGRNCLRFRRLFQDFKGVHIPKLYHEYTTDRLLVMERMRGVRIDDLEGITAMGVDRKQIARTGVDAYFKSVLEDGFFHADPHPGNLLVRGDGAICFMDFGMCGTVTDELKAILVNIFLAFITRDFDLLIDQHVEMGFIPDDIDIDAYRREFKEDLADFMDPLHGIPLNEVNFAEYLGEVLKVIIKHRMKVPADLLLIHKAMLLIQGMGSRLDPDFDIVSASRPYLDRMATDKSNPERIARKTLKHVKEGAEFVTLLPKQLKRIMSKVIRDDMNMKVTVKGLDPFVKDFDRSSNRIAMAMIISSMLLSSAIMHALNVGPSLYGFSIMGFLVFGFAAVLGTWLIISIIRSGRL